MIADLGGFALLLTVGLSLATAVVGFIGKIPDAAAMPYMRRGHRLLLLLIGWSFFALVMSFVNSDFSLRVVADNSMRATTLFYRITGSWGNHEGSMLLWLLILCLYGTAMTFKNWLSQPLQRSALAVHASIITGISTFVFLASNPFEILAPAPEDGYGMNPLLEDVGLAIHPPVLYLGYVGFAAVFSIAIGGLWRNLKPAEIFHQAHRYSMFALGWLSLGIGLGSWWAYRELGWGGWWFWDPVENASLLPWLAGMALCHSINASRKKGCLNSWTLLLALSCFSMSLIGTFLVRSGVVTSVHSFASDPTRGVFILSAIGVITGGSLLLFTIRAKQAAASNFSVISRESFLLLQSSLAAMSLAIVLLGTLYPMISQLAGLRAVSVGATYFSSALMPIAVIVMIAGAISHRMKWQGDDIFKLIISSWPDAIIAGLVTVLSIYGSGAKSAAAILMFACGGFMLSAGSRYLLKTKRLTSMPLAHIGAAILVIGAAGSTSGQIAHDETMRAGDVVNIGDYSATYSKYETAVKNNYAFFKAVMTITKNGDEIGILEPERRLYLGRNSPTSEASTMYDALKEIYVVVGETTSGGEIGIRIYITPFISLVWLGFMFISMGCWLAIPPNIKN